MVRNYAFQGLLQTKKGRRGRPLMCCLLIILLPQNLHPPLGQQHLVVLTVLVNPHQRHFEPLPVPCTFLLKRFSKLRLTRLKQE